MSNPFYSEEDDMTSAFMNSSANYLASDRLSCSSSGYNAVSDAERKRNDLLQQIQKVEERTLDSSRRGLGMLVDSEKVGVETAKDLEKQREQLVNTENRLDDINSTLKDTQKNINGIKSVFSSLKQWWVAPKSGAKGKDKKPDTKSLPTSPTEHKGPLINKHLGSALEHSEVSLEFCQNSQNHPALRLRGVDEYEEDHSDHNKFSKNVDQQLDDNLTMMSSGLSRLKDLAKGLGDEIRDQNESIDRIHDKADKADLKITSQNKDMNRILKR